MALILLAEVVVFYVGSAVIDVQGLGLEFISRSTF